MDKKYPILNIIDAIDGFGAVYYFCFFSVHFSVVGSIVGRKCPQNRICPRQKVAKTLVFALFLRKPDRIGIASDLRKICGHRTQKQTANLLKVEMTRKWQKCIKIVW